MEFTFDGRDQSKVTPQSDHWSERQAQIQRHMIDDNLSQSGRRGQERPAQWQMLEHEQAPSIMWRLVIQRVKVNDRRTWGGGCKYPANVASWIWSASPSDRINGFHTTLKKFSHCLLKGQKACARVKCTRCELDLVRHKHKKPIARASSHANSVSYQDAGAL